MRFSTAILLTVTIFSFTLSLAQFNITLMIPSIEIDLNLSSAQAGLLMSILVVSTVLFQIPMGLLADRMGGMKVVAASGIVLAIFSIMGGIAHSYYELLIARFGIGMGLSACGPVCSGLISRHIASNRSALAFGIFNIGISLGFVFVMLLFPVLMEYGGWRIGLLITLLPAVVLFSIAVLLYRHEGMPKETIDIHESLLYVKSLLSSHIFLALVIIYFISAWIYVGLLTWFPTFLIDTHGLDVSKSGLITALVVGIGIVSSPVGGVLSQKFGCQNIILITSAALFLFSIGMVIPLSLEIVTICGFFMGWFLPLYYGAYFSMASSMTRGKYASMGMGVYTCIGNAGPLVPPLLSGVLLDLTGSYSISFLHLVIIAAIGVALALYIIIRTKTN